MADSISTDRLRSSDDHTATGDEGVTIPETVKYTVSNPIPEEDAINVLGALCDKFLDVYELLLFNSTPLAHIFSSNLPSFRDTVSFIKTDVKLRGCVEGVAVKTMNMCRAIAEDVIGKALSLGEVVAQNDLYYLKT
jgi:hypothetical protein